MRITWLNLSAYIHDVILSSSVLPCPSTNSINNFNPIARESSLSFFDVQDGWIDERLKVGNGSCVSHTWGNDCMYGVWFPEEMASLIDSWKQITIIILTPLIVHDIDLSNDATCRQCLAAACLVMTQSMQFFEMDGDYHQFWSSPSNGFDKPIRRARQAPIPILYVKESQVLQSLPTTFRASQHLRDALHTVTLTRGAYVTSVSSWPS